MTDPIADYLTRVRNAYSAGMGRIPKDSLEMLYHLNTDCAEREKAGQHVFGPGIPEFVKDGGRLISDDCIRM